MFYRLIDKLDKYIPIPIAKAHCDVPCGIYDPITAQIDALTVVRMMDLMNALNQADEIGKTAYHNSMNRYISVKETHAEKVKHEVRIIHGDYIKEQHIEEYPELPKIVREIMVLGSKSRQTVDREIGLQLVAAVNKFAEIFWATKGVATKTAKAPYAPALEMVYPEL